VAATVVVAAAAAFFLYLSSTGGRGPAAPPGPPAVAVETASPPAGPAVAQAPPAAGTPAMANNRRPAYQEKDFRKNECRITSYNVSSGTVIIDVDPDGDEPAVVWHFTDDQAPSDREDDRI
jgi:hypothetical protein